MSDGGRLSEGNCGDHDNFGRSIAQIAVAQVCESLGFDGSKQSALDSFSEILIRYVSDLGKVSKFYANLSGRTESNLFDIVEGLVDLGFLKGKVRGRNPRVSEVVKEIGWYVRSVEEVPFKQSVPSFPVPVKRSTVPSFENIQETPPGKHILSWLPAFPDPHTYVHTPVWNVRKTDPRTDKVEQARQRRKAERSLLSLQQRLSNWVPHGPQQNRLSSSRLLQNGEIDENMSENGIGSKEVNSENQVLVLEAFAPAIDAAKNGFFDSVDGERNDVFLNKRPAIHFKSNFGRKLLKEPLELSLQKKGVGEITPWYGRDDNNDKKRRAEQILKESMENHEELAQL
ncbi:Transcription factor TFIID, subunit 8, C-terminal [Dillenia turbinata]|uniref:Transcription initiation factor TFIID subunit 8 n=1 Tax=Dillenia turbinata TaxID=194707 RepID=A0AAN8Z7D3_9MAGN